MLIIFVKNKGKNVDYHIHLSITVFPRLEHSTRLMRLPVPSTRMCVIVRPLV